MRASTGGTVVRVGEAGEDEAIIPLSQLGMLNESETAQPLDVRIQIGSNEFKQVFIETYRKARATGEI